MPFLERFFIEVGGFERISGEGIRVSIDGFELGVRVGARDSNEVYVGAFLFEVGEEALGE